MKENGNCTDLASYVYPIIPLPAIPGCILKTGQKFGAAVNGARLCSVTY